MATARTLILLLTLSLFPLPPMLLAQKEAKSPVLKGYKTEDEPSLPAQSDLIYQMWQAFIAARKANAGDVLAQHELGIRYLLGRGVEADTVKAAFWIEKAAEQNLLPAHFNMGILRYHGWGVPWNPFEAYRQFLYCARQGMPEAELAVAEFCMDDLVVPMNRTEAYTWAKKAADAGYAPARDALKDFGMHARAAAVDSASGSSAARNDSTPPPPSSANRHDPLSVPVALAEDTVTTANAWVVLKNALRSAGPELKDAFGMTRMLESELDLDSVSFLVITRAADNGSPEALAILGRCYEKGIRVHSDPVMASSYFVRALRMDAPRAGELLWKLLQDDRYVRQLKARAEEGDGDAEFAWAGLVALGYDPLLARAGAYLTEPQALKLLEQAAESGSAQAMVELGLCYYAGRWVTHDPDRARELWKEAAASGNREAQIRLAVITVRESSREGDLEPAVALLADAVQKGSVLAEVALGYCFETGSGVPRNAGAAAQLYATAARRGSQDAYRALKRMYDDIRPKEKEFQTAG